MREPTENIVAMRLTRRQQEILDFLRDNAEHFERPPTLDELCATLGLRSRGSLHKHVQALIQAGFVEPMAGQHRGIRLIAHEPVEDDIPFLGKIAAGRPIEALPQPEQIQVPPHLRTDKPCYVLQVVGDSMCEVGILDGDLVVIEQRDYARNGEIVVALVRGEEATLKRILQEPERTILYPENSAMHAMELAPHEVQIQGVLVGQMRSYR
ncbi:MAG: transcriptional repressor LexA [Chromatiaceae bacterium]|nr:transcriptional repressor LexA [Chromatiaceae bacterium]